MKHLTINIKPTVARHIYIYIIYIYIYIYIIVIYIDDMPGKKTVTDKKGKKRAVTSYM